MNKRNNKKGDALAEAATQGPQPRRHVCLQVPDSRTELQSCLDIQRQTDRLYSGGEQTDRDEQTERQTETNRQRRQTETVR